MLSNIARKMGFDMPAAVIEIIGQVVETIGEVADSEVIRSVGNALQESSETLSS